MISYPISLQATDTTKLCISILCREWTANANKSKWYYRILYKLIATSLSISMIYCELSVAKINYFIKVSGVLITCIPPGSSKLLLPWSGVGTSRVESSNGLLSGTEVTVHTVNPRAIGTIFTYPTNFLPTYCNFRH